MTTPRPFVPALALSVLLTGCAVKPIGLSGDEFQRCPSSPNCVSSDSEHPKHAIEPFELESDADFAWQRLYEILTDWPDLMVIKRTPDYLHVEARSKMFRFVDDLEFNLRQEEGIIAVRSAARTGYSDFGSNRERLEAIRDALRAEGAAR